MSNSIIEAQIELEIQKDIECQKCMTDPYYFASNYLIVDGKPFTAGYDRMIFNRLFNTPHLMYMRRERNEISKLYGE